MTPAERRAVRRIAERLTGREHSYGAYESDPIEAMLHETGHVVCALGLTGAMRHRDVHGRALDVNDTCRESGDMELNEAESLAFEFIVCKRLNHPLDEPLLIQEAELGDFGREMVSLCRGSRKVRAIARRFVAMVRKEARKTT